MRLEGSLFAALVALSIVLPARAQDGDAPPPATTDVVAGCVAAHEKARLSLLSEDWTAAREAVTVCAADSCPLALRSDCAAWGEDIEKALPTLLVVVERRTGGPPVTFELDGKPTPLVEPSAPIQTLPGHHRLVFDSPPYAPIVQELTLQKGEKNHLVRVRFGSDERPAPAAPRYETSRPITWTTIALSGGAIAAFASSTALLVSALSKRADARAQCAPVCSESVRSSIRSRLLFSDLTGGAGLILTGLAAYTFWKRPTVRERVAVSLPSVTVDGDKLEASIGGEF